MHVYIRGITIYKIHRSQNHNRARSRHSFCSACSLANCHADLRCSRTSASSSLTSQAFSSGISRATRTRSQYTPGSPWVAHGQPQHRDRTPHTPRRTASPSASRSSACRGNAAYPRTAPRRPARRPGEACARERGLHLSVPLRQQKQRLAGNPSTVPGLRPSGRRAGGGACLRSRRCSRAAGMRARSHRVGMQDP